MNIFAPFHRSSLKASNDNGKGNKAIKDSSFEVTAIIERVRRSSSLLQEPSQQVTAHFNRDEIGVGAVLRLGEFGATFAVTQLPHYSTAHPPVAVPRTVGVSSGDSQTIRSGASLSQSPEEDERRRICTSNVQRFQLKQLNPKLIKKHSKHRNANNRLYDVAAATLVLEALYLARLSHPNIVALRGIPLGEEYMQYVHEGFFLLTDRIVETLTDRLANWKEGEEHSGTVMLKVDTRSKVFREKMNIAKDVLGALDYLQSHHRIVVLNLNPSNIGFNHEGTVQLFDMGHCREVSSATAQAGTKTNNKAAASSSDKHLSDDEISVDDLSVMLGSPFVPDAAAFQATAIYASQMGSHRKVLPLANMGIVPRYLPPELVTKGTYCLQSDSYSFSLVLFEMLTLSKPFTALKPGQHLIQVCMEGKRPNLTLYQFPPALEKLLKQGWKHNYKKRLKISTMKQVLSSTSFTSSSSRQRASSKQQRLRQEIKSRSPAPPREGERKPRRRKKPKQPLPEQQDSRSLSPDHREKPSEIGRAPLRRKSDGNLFSMVSPTARKKSVQMTMAVRQKMSRRVST
jgi:Protein tyrosine and serine/threonine kinase